MIKNDVKTMKENIAIKIEGGNFTWGGNRDMKKPIKDSKVIVTSNLPKKEKDTKDHFVELINVTLKPTDSKNNAPLFEHDLIDDKSTGSISILILLKI